LAEVKHNRGFGISRENGHKSYDELIYPLTSVVAKKVRDNCDNMLGSFWENRGGIGRIFICQGGIFYLEKFQGFGPLGKV